MMRAVRTTVLKNLAHACAEEWVGRRGGRDELEQVIYCALEKAELEGRLREQWQQWSAERPRVPRGK